MTNYYIPKNITYLRQSVARVVFYAHNSCITRALLFGSSMYKIINEHFSLNLFRPNNKLTLVRLHFHVLWQQSLLVQIQIFATFLALGVQMTLLLGHPTNKTDLNFYKAFGGMVWTE